jgi:hypothetical protein
VTVTQGGGFRVNDRELVNASRRDAARGDPEARLAGARRCRDGARRRPRHAPVGGHRDGRDRAARLPRDQHRHRDRRPPPVQLPARRSCAAPVPPRRSLVDPQAPRSTTRARVSAPARLCAAARGHVLDRRARHGAVRRHRFRARLSRQGVPRRHLRRRRPRACCGWCRSARSCCSRCAASATTSPTTFRAGWGARSSRRCARSCSRTTCACRPLLRHRIRLGPDAVAADVQRRAGRRGRPPTPSPC